MVKYNKIQKNYSTLNGKLNISIGKLVSQLVNQHSTFYQINTPKLMSGEKVVKLYFAEVLVTRA